MERTKHNSINTNQRIQALSALVGRAMLATRLGYAYDGVRDVYEALGYKKDLEYKDYTTQYSRQDIAKAVINKPVEATWRGDVTLVEKGQKGPSKFQASWEKLEEKLELKDKFIRIDKLSGLGEYGVLLLGFDDVTKVEDLSKPVTGTNRQLKYVKPLGEGHVEITKWESDAKSERFGLPLMYTVELTSDEETSSSVKTSKLKVHYTRIIHVTGELLESESKGVPRLQAIFNRLKDLEKTVGGSAEMFWRGARPGYKGDVKDDFNMTEAVKDDLQDQIDEYEHKLRRILVTEGVDLEGLEIQVSSPKDHVDVQIQMIAAETGIPKRMLTGSERGELSSSQDKDNWLETVQTRREEYAEPKIINRFVNRCIQYGVLTKPDKGYDVIWSDLFAPSEKDRTEIGLNRATALKEYSENPMAQMIVSPDAFMEYVLGFSQEQIDMIQQKGVDTILEEQQAIEETEEE